MKIKIVFFNSGDEIIFHALNEPMVDYYIENINKAGVNNFFITKNNSNKLFEDLKIRLCEMNSFLKDLVDYQFEEASIDQFSLNKLHSEWATLQQFKIDVRDMKQKYKEELFHQLPDDNMNININHAAKLLGKETLNSEINLFIHLLEESFFKIKGSTKNWFQIENKFKKSCLSSYPSQLTLPFNHLGRTLYNKFLHMDNNLEFNDENSFNELLGFVEINLIRTQTINFSQEYISWCKNLNRNPIGDYLNIGTLLDIEERLTYYRQIIFNNVKMQNNFFIEQG